MKILCTILFTFSALSLWAQQDTAVHSAPQLHPAYQPHSVIPTVSLGFIDAYRNNYSLPAGFEKNNTSGFVPIYAKLEYGVGRNFGLAATFCYDAFQYNFSQQYQGNAGPFIRSRTDAFRLFSGGITAFYHLGKVIRVKQLDPFVGIGVALNNIRYNAYPGGDSTAPRLEHTATFYLKAGARYYISDQFSLFCDVGYDKQSVFSIGASCRFFSKKKL